MKKVLIGMAVVLVVAAAGAGGFFYWREQRLAAFASESFGSPQAKRVEVPVGTGPRALGALLATHGVVADGELFYQYIRSQKAGPKLKAGEYEFAGALAPTQVLAKIVAGDVKKYRFTIPEGLRVEEILPLIAQSELKLDLAKLTARSQDPAFLKRVGVPANRIEGYLYPDTYTFTRNADEEDVLAKMVARTLEEYRAANSKRQAGISLDLHQTMTLASIIEKETGTPVERPRISCVFHNRLKQKIKLQTDPTVIYAMKELRGVYSKNITSKDLITDHPYSTYTRFGLPPGPIASAGAAAITAALDPLVCADLFFVSRNDGTHIFCPTLQCHNEAVKKWQVEFFRKQKARKRSG